MEEGRLGVKGIDALPVVYDRSAWVEVVGKRKARVKG